MSISEKAEKLASEAEGLQGTDIPRKWIGAKPDLVEACERALFVLQDLAETDGALVAVEIAQLGAALAKARGEAEWLSENW